MTKLFNSRSLRPFKKKRGARLRSGFEDKIFKQLNKLCGFLYEGTALKYTLEKDYVVDFTISQFPPVYVETKGWFKPSDRSKMLAVKRDNPDADIRIVFQYDNWLTKKKKQRYSDWCNKHGFLWSVGQIPDAWIKNK